MSTPAQRSAARGLNRTPVRDDSHARGILKRELRQAFAHRDACFAKPRHTRGGSLTRQVASLKENFRDAYHNLVVFHTTAQVSRRSKKSVEVYTLLDTLQSNPSTRLTASTLLDLRMVVMDPVRCIRTDFADGLEYYSACRISLHLLERLVRRQQAHSLPEITFHLIPLALTFSASINLSSIQGKFILITRLGYYVMKRQPADPVPIAISWIPREGYTPRQHAKLEGLSRTLVDESLIMPEPAFKRARVISPGDAHLVLPGLGAYLPASDSPRHVTLTREVMDQCRPYLVDAQDKS